MITGLLVLLACQLVGEMIVRSLDVPVPGPIVGMVVFFAVLQVRRPQRESPLVRGPQTLLTYLPLLYVPAGVGVVSYLTLLRSEAGPAVAGLTLSWLAGLLATAGTAGLLLRLRARGGRAR